MITKENQKQSKLGVASCLIALAIWLYLGIIFFFLTYVPGFTRYLDNHLFRNSDGSSAFGTMFLAMILFFGFFILIPFGGHLVGLILGIAGAVQKSKKRLFGVIGIVLNVLPFIVVLIWNLLPGF
jgi:hypothetical protein